MPALLDLGVAAIALLLMAGFALLLLIAQRVIPNVPVFGSVIRDAVVGALTSIRNDLWNFIKAMVRPVVDAWWTTQVWAMRILGWGANAVERVPWLVYSNVVAAVNRSVQLYNAAIGYAGLVAAAAVAHADAIVASLWNTTLAALGAESFYRISGDMNVAAGAAAGAAAAVAHADALGVQAQEGLGAESYNRIVGDQGVLSHADNLFTSVTASLDNAVAGIRSDISTAVQGVEGYASDVAGAASAAAAAGVLAQVMPLVTSLTTEAETCLRPLCETVTPNAPQLGRLGKILQDLEGVGVLAAVLALIDEAAHHPGAVAGAVRTVADDVARPVLVGARDLIGL